MAKNVGKRHGERFEAAVAAGDDEHAEALVDLLSASDIPLLRHMAESNQGDHCWWGIRGLAQIGNGDVVPILVARLQHAEPSIRAAASLALGEIHSRHAEAVVPHLSHLILLLTDADALVRQAAVDGLAHCGDDAVDLLAEALNSEIDALRVRAAMALHRIGTVKTAPSLYHHLEDPNPLVRHHAYETLSNLGLLETMLLRR
jgi:HEAT repeat protein